MVGSRCAKLTSIFGNAVISGTTNANYVEPTERLVMEKQKMKEAGRDAEDVRQKEVRAQSSSS